MENDTHTTTLDNLAENFPDLMLRQREAKGFTIGRGKKLYWYITPYSSRGMYRCLPLEDDGGLGWPVYHYPEKEVTIHYKD